MDNHKNEINTIDLSLNKIEEKDTSDENIEIKEEKLITKLKGKKGLCGVLGGLIAVLVKSKAILFLILTKFKFILILLKLGKFASTLISMLLMILIYARIYGWIFGIGFVLLLFIHEMGHY